MAKKLFSFGILIVFIFLMAGHFVTYELLLQNNRVQMLHEVKSGIHHSEIETIDLTKAEAKSLIDGDEISFNNNRYDILKIEDHGDKVLISAISDASEERLISGLNDNYENYYSHSQSHDKNTANLLNDFFKEYTNSSMMSFTPNHNIYSRAFQIPLSTDKSFKGYSFGLIQPPRA